MRPIPPGRWHCSIHCVTPRVVEVCPICADPTVWSRLWEHDDGRITDGEHGQEVPYPLTVTD